MSVRPKRGVSRSRVCMPKRVTKIWASFTMVTDFRSRCLNAFRSVIEEEEEEEEEGRRRRKMR